MVRDAKQKFINWRKITIWNQWDWRAKSRNIFNSHAVGVSLNRTWYLSIHFQGFIMEVSYRRKMVIPTLKTFKTYVLYRLPLKFGWVEKKIDFSPTVCEFRRKIEFKRLWTGVDNKSHFRDWDWDLGFLLKLWDLGFIYKKSEIWDPGIPDCRPLVVKL